MPVLQQILLHLYCVSHKSLSVLEAKKPVFAEYSSSKISISGSKDKLKNKRLLLLLIGYCFFSIFLRLELFSFNSLSLDHYRHSIKQVTGL